MPVREDFQKLALYSLGKKKEADDLEKQGIMPYMKIGVTPAADLGARDIGFTIFTTEH